MHPPPSSGLIRRLMGQNPINCRGRLPAFCFKIVQVGNPVSSPTVSVIIPTRNRADFLREALASVVLAGGRMDFPIKMRQGTPRLQAGGECRAAFPKAALAAKPRPLPAPFVCKIA
jgi:hypothetical protein